VVCHASKKSLKEKQLRAQRAIVSVSVCNCGSFVFTRHASRPEFVVSNPTRVLTKSQVTYPPAIGELETSRSQGLICLSTQVSCKATVAVHHCKRTSGQPSAIHCAIVRARPPPLQYPNAHKINSISLYGLFPCHVQVSHTLSVPLVHRVPGPLAAVLHVPDLRETGTRNAEEL
jgi:hypothetical protein